MTSTNQQSHQPLPASVAAVWGAFLLEGMLIERSVHERIDRIIETWQQGFIELMIEACQCLDPLWNEVRDHWQQPEKFDGVFEYEVVAPLGRFLGNHLLQHRSLPSLDHQQGAIAELVDIFFSLAPAPEATATN
jgi:hypothetical protein